MKTLTLASLWILGALATTAFASDGNYRKLANVAPGSQTLGQGEVMLLTVKRPTPYFMSPHSDAAPSNVSVVGVCKDNLGYTYASNSSNDKGYGTCLENATSPSGSTVNEYFGPAQRQTGAGLGFRVGD